VRLFFSVLAVLLAGLQCVSFSLTSKDIAAKLTEKTTKEIHRRNPDMKGTRIQIDFKDAEKIFSDISSIKGKLTFELDFPQNRRIAGKMILPFIVYSDGEINTHAYIDSDVKIYKYVIIASTKLKKGDIISSDNIKSVETDISVLPDSVIFDKNKVLGLETSTLIPSGTVLLNFMVRKVPMIKKGEIVDMTMRSSQLVLRTKVIALSDGYFGNIINVKNINSKKILAGKIVSSVEVQVP